jgi:hypothetical protein
VLYNHDFVRIQLYGKMCKQHMLPPREELGKLIDSPSHTMYPKN